MIIHTGDFKFDYTPVRGGGPGFTRLGELGAQGVLALLSDSTGAERAGYTPSEPVIVPAFDQIFREAPGRIIVATFASLLSRVQQVIDAAHAPRPRGGAGRLLDAQDRRDRAASWATWRCRTGCWSSSTRRCACRIRRSPSSPPAARASPRPRWRAWPKAPIARSRSSPATPSCSPPRPSPATRKRWRGSINKLFARGAEVIYPPLAAVHVSGHASQEEQKLMLSLTRPRFFVPIHGELRHLHAHAELARQLGIPADNILMLENGSVLEFTADSARIVEPMPGGDVFVDGSGVGDIGPAVMRRAGDLVPRRLRDRGGAHQRGDRRGRAASRSWCRAASCYLRESGDLMERAAERRGNALQAAAAGSAQAIIERTQDTLGRFFYEETRRKPMVVAIVTRCEGNKAGDHGELVLPGPCRQSRLIDLVLRPSPSPGSRGPPSP